jgi:hypothetical protein
MISDVQLRELLAQKSETKNLDYKVSFNWDAADNEVFNWNNPDANMIRGWQQKLLSRTF